MDKTQQGVWGGQELGAACFGVKTYIYQSQGKKRVKGEASMTARACSLVGLRERFFYFISRLPGEPLEDFIQGKWCNKIDL